MSMTREEAVAAFLKDRTLVQKVTFDNHWVSACWHDLDPSNAWHSNNYRLTTRPVPPGDLTWEEARDAQKAGKAVQWTVSGRVWNDQDDDVKVGTLTDQQLAWRLKPTPKLVPLGPEDVPPGSVVRLLPDHSWLAVISSMNGGVWLCGFREHACAFHTFDTLKSSGLEISTDSGKSWRPCSKPEVAS